MTSTTKWVWGVIVLGLGIGWIGMSPPQAAAPEGSNAMVPIETVANYLHAVIQADRDTYTRHVVERLQLKNVVVASENWEQKNTLPLPAQFLMESGKTIAKMGSGIQYRLISMWPINKRNAAASDFEKAGLGTVLTHPDRPYTGYAKSAGGQQFQALYADLAVTQACIGCHNAHPNSPKQDFKLNDVMGALVITIPVSQ